jgi:hypothetical protein
VIVDADGDRLLAKYYDEKEKSEQLKYESTLYKKTKALNSKSDGKLTSDDPLSCHLTDNHVGKWLYL